jgi:hypothetical protein
MEDTAEGKETKDMTKSSILKATFRVLNLKLAKINVPLLVTNHVYDVVGAYVPTKEMSGGCLIAGTQIITKHGITNIEDVNASVKQFIDNQVVATKKLLIDNTEIKQVGENKFTYPKLSDDFAKDRNVNLNKKNLSANDITNLLTFARVNYVISNIEFHKILFGDPYQFAIKDKNGKIILDETKRIKSFLSPARTTFDTPEFNTFLNNEYNNVDEEGTLALEPTDPGYHQHKAYVNTFTAKDVEIQGRLLGKTNEADAASWIMDGTYREVLLKNHQWDDRAEAWHQYQMSYMRSTLARKDEYEYTNDKLKDHDVQTLSKPEPIYVTNILKPIVRGNKYNKNTVDLVLDKFSQMPVYYSMVEGTNLEKLYLKMMKEGFGIPARKTEASI